MNLNINKNNINEFGRFTKLKESVNNIKARSYLEETLETKLKPHEVSLKVDNILRDFIYENGFGIEEYLSELKTEKKKD